VSIGVDDFLTPAKDAGFDFFSGVPCSFLTPVINRVIGDDGLSYVGAASEGEAVAIASGAWLAGHETVVMCQNSGLGNAVNPLTSLNFPFRIPTLMIVTWRGGPGPTDEPQHELMGEITPDVLDVIRVPRAAFPASQNEISGALSEARDSMSKTDLPFAFIMQKGDVNSYKLDAKAPPPAPKGQTEDRRENGAQTTRMAAMERMLSVLPDSAAIIATTGFTGRELFTLEDRPQHLYQVGSMGCAAPMGLGVALNTDKRVVVIDGDGAAMMKLGALATVGAYAPNNLLHIVMDNAAYESTGGQPTVSASVDFAGVAAACGYKEAFTCDSLSGLEKIISETASRPGPHLVHMVIKAGHPDTLGRPTIKPPEVARRFKDFIAS
jgi:phosphonopyruvate decarboxylase